MAGFALGELVASIAATIAASATGYHQSSGAAQPVAVTVAGVAGLWVGFVAAAVFVSRTRGTGSVARDFGWRVGAWWDLPLGAAIGLASQYGLVPLLYLPFHHVDRTLTRQLGQPAQRETAAAHGSGSVLILFLFLAIGAPLVEELFFRGLLLRALLERTGPAVAIVVSALVFALAHFEALQFAGLAAFGVVLAVLAWRTGRLGPSIGAHIAFNAAAVITVVHFG